MRRRATNVQAGFLSVAMAAVISLALMCATQAKPANPGPPSWRALNASQMAPARAIPRKKPADKPARWSASTEPHTTATVDSGEGVPLPEKNPATHPTSDSTVTIAQKPIAGRLASSPQVSAPTPADASSDNIKLSPMDVVTTEVAGEEEKEKEKIDQTPAAPAAPMGEGPASKQYCNNMVSAAADARYAWQKKALIQTEQEVAKRVAELDVKIAEYQKWMARREEFSRKAEAVVVGIYQKMKPDAAAQQLAIIDEEIAAAVLTKLDARSASAVMNEMDPKRAARLTAIITGAAKGPGGKSPAIQTPAPATPAAPKENGT